MLVASAFFAFATAQPLSAAPPPHERLEWATEFVLKHSQPVVAVAASSDRIATADSEGGVTLWDARTGKESQTLFDEKVKAAPATRLQFSPDGNWLFLTTNDGKQIHVCECRKPKQLQVFASRELKKPYSVIGITQGTPRWITTLGGRTPWFYRIATDAQAPLGDVEQPFPVDLKAPGPITHIAATDTTLITVASGVLHGRPADRNQKSWSATLLNIRPMGLALSADDELVAVAGEEGEVRVFTAQNGNAVNRFRAHKVTAWSAAFSPDGKRLATASEDATVRVWNPITGDEVSVLKGHISGVVAVTFTPDGKRLVSGSDDKTVRVWKMK